MKRRSLPSPTALADVPALSPSAAPRKRSRSPMRLAAVAVGLALVAWAVVAAVLVLRARGAAMAGKAELERAEGSLSAQTVVDSRAPLESLGRGQRQLAHAQALLSNPVLLPVRPLPFVGRQLASARALSGAGHDLAGAGVTAAAALQQTLDGSLRTPAQRAEAATRVASTMADLQARLDHVDLGPSGALVGPLADARRQADDQLGRASHMVAVARSAAEATSAMLHGSHHVLFLAANNAEMRAGSGMWLALTDATVRDGQFSFGQAGSVKDFAVPAAGVPYRGDLADRWSFLTPNAEWRNTNASPRFDVTAELASRMWVAAGGAPVDMVVSLDAVALQQIMEATGPVQVEGATVSADDVLDLVLKEQYEQLSPDRHEDQALLAKAVFGAVNDGRGSPAALVPAFVRAVQGRHLMVWSSDPAVEDQWKGAKAAGHLDGSSLLLSILNRGGNKLDPYLDVDATLDITPRPGGADASLVLQLENRASPSLPPYVTGSFGDTTIPSGAYTGIVAVNLPAFASQAGFTGVEHLGVGGPDGPTQVVGYQLAVPPGASRTVTLHFTLPADGQIDVLPTARVPAVQWHLPGRTADDTARQTLTW